VLSRSGRRPVRCVPTSSAIVYASPAADGSPVIARVTRPGTTSPPRIVNELVDDAGDEGAGHMHERLPQPIAKLCTFLVDRCTFAGAALTGGDVNDALGCQSLGGKGLNELAKAFPRGAGDVGESVVRHHVLEPDTPEERHEQASA
jgi:hypothetical protein